MGFHSYVKLDCSYFTLWYQGTVSSGLFGIREMYRMVWYRMWKYTALCSQVRTRRLTLECVRIFPIGSDAKEPVKAVGQSKVSIRPYELHNGNGRLDVYLRLPPSSPLKVSGSFLRKLSTMSFKGVALPTRDDVKNSLNLKEQHVTEHATVYCQ